MFFGLYLFQPTANLNRPQKNVAMYNVFKEPMVNLLESERLRAREKKNHKFRAQGLENFA